MFSDIDTTGGTGVSTITNQVDTGVKNYDYTQSFITPLKQNHSAPEICDTATTTTPVQPNFHTRIFQQGVLKLQQHH